MLLGIHTKRDFDAINSINKVSILKALSSLQLNQIVLSIRFINLLFLTQCRIAYKYTNQFYFISCYTTVRLIKLMFQDHFN